MLRKIDIVCGHSGEGRDSWDRSTDETCVDGFVFTDQPVSGWPARPQASFESFGRRLSPRNVDEIEYLTVRLRNALGCHHSLHVDIVRVVEFGLPKLMSKFSFGIIDDASGEQEVLAFTRTDPPEIVLKESVYLGAAKGDPVNRFIVAHELAHIVLHAERYELPVFDLNGFEALNEIEKEADIFASAFLMPISLIRGRSVSNIANNFGVTEAMARQRLNIVAAENNVDLVRHIKETTLRPPL